MDYEQTKAKKYQSIPVTAESHETVVTVNLTTLTAKQQYRKAKAEHQQAIRQEFKQAYHSIRRHRLLIKQARINYKLSK